MIWFFLFFIKIVTDCQGPKVRVIVLPFLSKYSPTIDRSKGETTFSLSFCRLLKIQLTRDSSGIDVHVLLNQINKQKINKIYFDKWLVWLWCRSFSRFNCGHCCCSYSGCCCISCCCVWHCSILIFHPFWHASRFLKMQNTIFKQGFESGVRGTSGP